MSKLHYPKTPAIRLLETKQIRFVVHPYPFEEHGGTRHAAEILHVSEHAIIKTLVMETDPRHPLLVLMHGDREVSLKQFARVLGVKRVKPCDIPVAQKYTGYQVGGISPFGTRARLPAYVESTIFDLEKMFINGGKRGLLVEIDPHDLEAAFPVTRVEIAS